MKISDIKKGNFCVRVFRNSRCEFKDSRPELNAQKRFERAFWDQSASNFPADTYLKY